MLLSSKQEKNSYSTRVVFSQEARRELYEGLRIAAETVCCTLGPRGKTVLIQKPGSTPIITKDGVTVSKSISLKDPIKKMGCELIKEAASQTNDVAGDGTTTSTVLTYSMVKSGLKLLEAGYPAEDLISGITIATSAVLNHLQTSAKHLSTLEEICQIGTISANGDNNIGEIISKAMDKVGNDGIITVEDAKGLNTTLDFVEGMQFDRGYLSPYFVTNSEKMNVVFHDAKVLVTDKKLNSLKDLIPILEQTMQNKTPLIIIADEVEGDALQGLVLNKLNANLQVVAVKSPGFGKYKDELLSDISALSNTKLVSNSTGVALNSLTLKDLGTLKKVIVDAKSTTLVSENVNDSLSEYINDLRFQMKDVSISQEELTNLKTRLAKLSSGVAVIKVGGSTELEMIERKYRIEDALHATRAAAEEGIVPGGGIALFNSISSISKVNKENQFSEGIKAGISIVHDACLAPIKRIASNAGCSSDVILNELNRLRVNDQFVGWNAKTEEYTDLLKAGVIDPVKVTRTALKNAASVAKTFLSLDAIIVEEVE